MKWFPNALLYSSTKAFVTSFTKGLALELQGSNVDLQCLEPFAVATNITDHWGIKTVGTTCDKVIRSSLDNLGKNPHDIQHVGTLKCEVGSMFCIYWCGNSLSWVWNFWAEKGLAYLASVSKRT